MSNQEIVQKLWNLCNVLRDDGITYHQYVTELTYILFLKMLQETDEEKSIAKSIIGLQELLDKQANNEELSPQDKNALSEKETIKDYSWNKLVSLDGITLKQYYNKLLRLLGEHCNGHIRDIYRDARSNIDEPKNLEKIIHSLNTLDWYSVDTDGFGDLYEGLLEKNANEKKSGAGQYFTPRVLIDVMVELTKPQLGELCNDPACGTFGFMIAANKYINDNNGVFKLPVEKFDFQKKKAFTGCELVPDTHRLAMMNAMIHGIEGDITLGNTLLAQGKRFEEFDVVLTNPPFGTKQGGETAARDDFTFPTSNKQLNFLQHIYRSLKKNGIARAAVVLPDNVLFADGDGAKIRKDLMDKCNLHTVLRLPTGIFYAQGVKTNVLFFTRGTTDKGNTKDVCFYDMRTNMPSFGKTTPLKKEHFNGFIKALKDRDKNKDKTSSSGDHASINKHVSIDDEFSVTANRFSKFTRQEITDKKDSLDLGLIRDDSVLDYEDLMNPIDSGEEVISQLEEAVDLIRSVVKELKSLGGDR